MSTCQRCIERPRLRYETIPDLVFCSEECARDLWTRSRQLIGVKRGREENEEVIVADPRLLLALPKDVLVLILQKLSFKALLRVAGTNQYLRGVIREKNVWERVIGRPIPKYAQGDEVGFAFSLWLFERLSGKGGEFRIVCVFKTVTTLKIVRYSNYIWLETDISDADYDYFAKFSYDISGASLVRSRNDLSFMAGNPESMIRILYNFWKDGFRWKIDE
jgi:hypothetical protein